MATTHSSFFPINAFGNKKLSSIMKDTGSKIVKDGNFNGLQRIIIKGTNEQILSACSLINDATDSYKRWKLYKKKTLQNKKKFIGYDFNIQKTTKKNIQNSPTYIYKNNKFTYLEIMDEDFKPNITEDTIKKNSYTIKDIDFPNINELTKQQYSFIDKSSWTDIVSNTKFIPNNTDYYVDESSCDREYIEFFEED